MTTPRVLQIAKHFAPDAGGIELVTQSISDLLATRGICADVLATELDGSPYREMALPYTVHRMPNALRWGNKGISPAYVRAIGRLSDDHDVAVLHMPNPVAVAAALAGWRKPLVLLWHAETPQALIRTIAAPFDRALIRRSDVVVAPTAIHLSASVHADLLVDKGKVIGFPLDVARFGQKGSAVVDSGSVSAIRQFVGQRSIILAVGRLVAYKGFDILIEAAGLLHTDAAVVIVGSGPQHDSLVAAIGQHGAESRVRLAGRLSDAELGMLLRETRVACMPSISAAEMYGMAQVEAMAFGIPVVATNIPGSGVPLVNKHDESGLIVPPGDVLALATVLNRLLRDEALHSRLGQGARQRWHDHHDPAKVADQYFKLRFTMSGTSNVPRGHSPWFVMFSAR